MPREIKDLRVFNVGLISNPDMKDIPDEAQTEGSYNLDVEVAGKLKGIPMNTTHTSYGQSGTISAWIGKSDGEWDLVYTDGTNIKIIQDFYSLNSAPTQSHRRTDRTGAQCPPPESRKRGSPRR